MNTSSAQIFIWRTSRFHRDGFPVFVGRRNAKTSLTACDVLTLNCVGQHRCVTRGCTFYRDSSRSRHGNATATTRMTQCATTTNSNTQPIAIDARMRRFSLANDEARMRTQDGSTTKNNIQQTTHNNKQHDSGKTREVAKVARRLSLSAHAARRLRERQREKEKCECACISSG